MSSVPIVLKPEWNEWLEESARQEARTPSELVNEALEYYYHTRQREKLNQEIAAYEEMHARLWQSMPGEWVAIHQQNLVDHDQHRLILYRRIRAKYGRTSVLLRQVQEQPTEEIWWRSIRTEAVAR
ncbi:MAG: hypothetical protein M3Q45_08595 [Chloroflexota bacterium]|nr:hypothetical protein [Chloroflexota bacterium]